MTRAHATRDARPDVVDQAEPGRPARPPPPALPSRAAAGGRGAPGEALRQAGQGREREDRRPRPVRRAEGVRGAPPLCGGQCGWGRGGGSMIQGFKRRLPRAERRWGVESRSFVCGMFIGRLFC